MLYSIDFRLSNGVRVRTGIGSVAIANKIILKVFTACSSSLYPIPGYSRSGGVKSQLQLCILDLFINEGVESLHILLWSVNVHEATVNGWNATWSVVKALKISVVGVQTAEVKFWPGVTAVTIESMGVVTPERWCKVSPERGGHLHVTFRSSYNQNQKWHQVTSIPFWSWSMD